MKLRVLVTGVLLGVLMVCSVAEAAKSTVTVRVVDAQGKGGERRVEGAVVQIWDTKGDCVGTKLTGPNGEVTFEGLEGRTAYVIKVKVTAADGTEKEGAGGFKTNKHGGAGLQIVRLN